MQNERGRHERLQMLVEPKLMEKVEDFRFTNRIATRAEAVRKLIETGLAVEKTKSGHSEMPVG